MTTLLLCFLVLLRPSLLGTDSIEYHFPRHIEKRMARWIELIDSKETASIFFCLHHSNRKAGELQVICCSGLGKDAVGILAERSRRYVFVKGRKIPILFDYDERYSLSPDQDIIDIGPYGYRDGTVKRRAYLFHGPTFSFKVKKSTNEIIGKESENHIDADLFRDTNHAIVYVFSDEVERVLCEEYERRKENDINCLQIAIDDEGNTVFQWKRLPRIDSQTNRFAVVGKYYIPLLFDYDEWFAR